MAYQFTEICSTIRRYSVRGTCHIWNCDPSSANVEAERLLNSVMGFPKIEDVIVEATRSATGSVDVNNVLKERLEGRSVDVGSTKVVSIQSTADGIEVLLEKYADSPSLSGRRLQIHAAFQKKDALGIALFSRGEELHVLVR